MRNIFPAKSNTKCTRETIPRHFCKNSKQSMSLDQWSKVVYSFFLTCQTEIYRDILKLSSRPLDVTSYKGFSKQKGGLELVFLPHFFFCIIFEKDYFSFYILLPDQISLSDYLYFLRYQVICILQLFVNQVQTS